ncbi:MAG: SEC-C metal-binding domain-containing protein [Tepidisphaeraceae bacterium]
MSRMGWSLQIGPYDPCPCGSGEKYKFCCAAKAKANRHGKYPIGTVAYYGPDDKTTTKIVAGVILSEEAEPILLKWMGMNVVGDAKIAEEIKRFLAKHGVKSVVVTEGILGCPHEEGIDFPRGQDCPVCPFWAGKQGSARRDDLDDEPWDEEDEDETDGFVEDDTDDDDEPEIDHDACFDRIKQVLGDGQQDRDQAIDVLFNYLQAHLQLPCEVTGIEDFRWEEPYVIGGWSAAEYKKLRKTQPSYMDRYELHGLEREGGSEWMLFYEDIGARVKRIFDGKLFILGLAELKATDKQSPNHQLLEDYSVWFVNSR